MARLPGDLENLEKSENLKTTKIKNLTLKTPKSCRFQGSDPKLDLTLGGLQPKKKPNATANFKFGTGFFRFFFGFFRFFWVFFGFSILANFDWFNGLLLSGSFC